MTPALQRELEGYARHFGLGVGYNFTLPDKVPGFFDSRSLYIIINARKPRCDQALTLAHELGHYLFHHERKPRNYMPWYVERPWKSRLVIVWAGLMKRLIRRTFTQEWEADLWAFILLFHTGALSVLVELWKLYPDKRLVMVLAYGAVAHGIAQRGAGHFLLLRLSAFLSQAKSLADS